MQTTSKLRKDYRTFSTILKSILGCLIAFYSLFVHAATIHSLANSPFDLVQTTGQQSLAHTQIVTSHTVTAVSSFSPESLNGVDIVYYEAGLLLPNDIFALVSFVQAGGRLIIAGDHGLYINPNKIANEFLVSYSSGQPTSLLGIHTATTFGTPGSVLDGAGGHVYQFSTNAPNDGLQSSNPNFKVLARFSPGQIALGQLPFGIGDVIFLTDLNTFDDNRLGNLDNQKLWTNLFNYEAIPEPTTVLLLLAMAGIFWRTRLSGNWIRQLTTPVVLTAALIAPSFGHATLIADPDLLDESTYPVGSIINQAFEGLTLSSYGTPDPYYSFPGNVVRYAHGGAVVTHTLGYDKIYNYFSPNYSISDTWGGTFWGRLILRVDLQQPARSAFADIIAFGASSDLMKLTAYDASGGQLGTAYHQDFPYGLPPTRVEYSQTASTIAYFTVTDNHVVPFGFVIDRIGAYSSQTGDFDSDGDVDGADFLAWQRSPNIGNLSEWQENYGIPVPPSGSGAAIPEPATLLLILIGILVAAWLKRSVCRIQSTRY